MTTYYAGIGSRRTPQPVLYLMERLASAIADRDYKLRSGHAPGADQAFESGAKGVAEIYLPWQRFEQDVPLGGVPYYPPSPAAREISSRFHPAWSRLTPAVQLLHARNAHQVLGRELDEPAQFVICWTPDGSLDGRGSNSGGTGQALRIAAAYQIPVYNLALREHRAWAVGWCS